MPFCGISVRLIFNNFSSIPLPKYNFHVWFLSIVYICLRPRIKSVYVKPIMWYLKPQTTVILLGLENLNSSAFHTHNFVVWVRMNSLLKSLALSVWCSFPGMHFVKCSILSGVSVLHVLFYCYHLCYAVIHNSFAASLGVSWIAFIEWDK